MVKNAGPLFNVIKGFKNSLQMYYTMLNMLVNLISTYYLLHMKVDCNKKHLYKALAFSSDEKAINL